MNDTTAKLLNREVVYPEGANYPTTRYSYACPCGKGKVVYETVSGFDDDYAFIECEESKQKYKVVLGCGHKWQLEKK